MLFNALPNKEKVQVVNFLPMNYLELNQFIKYLGFILKLSDYKYEEWIWVYNKIEARISIWCNIWLLMGGRLVLVKVVLESIYVYWISIAHIPKGILNKITKKCFSFPHIGKREKEGIPSVEWTKVTNLKEFGGWGLNNIHIFNMALALKCLWRLVYNKALWEKVMKYKYLRGISIEDWFKKERKIPQGGSIVWKALIRAFPLIGKWIA
jgi:hypothetical protein